MNYAGHEKLRAEVAEVANAMCDLRTTMNEMEQRYSFNADTLPERLVRHRNIVADAFALLSCPTPETGKSKFSPLPAFP
ncbi:TPA: hypothetical protein JLR87_004376 [Escherichia coli]|nr:hypothetical protein [Escherichia coli]